MSKRFTATEKWDKEWFQTLKPKHKCLWMFLCDRCDPAGIWESNFALATFSIGEKITEADMKFLGDDRIEKIAPGKFLIKNFIEYQYGKLSKDCKPHVPIFKILEKNNLDYETLSKGYQKGIETLKEKDKDKEEEKEKVKEKESEEKTEKIILPFLEPEFELAWNGWKEYKKDQFKFTFKGEHSEQIALKALAELARNDCTTALKIIEQSMANGWKGFFELKNGYQNGKPNHTGIKRDARREPTGQSFGEL